MCTGHLTHDTALWTDETHYQLDAINQISPAFLALVFLLLFDLKPFPFLNCTLSSLIYEP